jgi:hypothetical protein
MTRHARPEHQLASLVLRCLGGSIRSAGYLPFFWLTSTASEEVARIRRAKARRQARARSSRRAARNRLG